MIEILVQLATKVKTIPFDVVYLSQKYEVHVSPEQYKLGRYDSSETHKRYSNNENLRIHVNAFFLKKINISISIRL